MNAQDSYLDALCREAMIAARRSFDIKDRQVRAWERASVIWIANLIISKRTKEPQS
jgi:hypothetical protein